MPTFPPLWSSSATPCMSLCMRLKMQESYTFYYAPQMENYLDLETRFENLSRLKLMAGRAQYQEGTGTAEELVWDTLDSFKLDYGT